MKNFKRNILQTVIGMACIVLPMSKIHAQSNDGKTHGSAVAGFGVSYTMPVEHGISGYGATANVGYAAYTKMLDTDANCCAMFLLDGGVSRFDTKINKYRYDINALFKLGIEYRRVAFMFTKGCALAFDGSGYGQVMDIHGVGLDVVVAPRTKMYVDCWYSNPSLDEKSPLSHAAVHQKWSVRTGLIFTLSHKKHQR